MSLPPDIPNSIYLLARNAGSTSTAASASADNSHVTAARGSGPAECRLPFHPCPLRARSDGPDGHSRPSAAMPSWVSPARRHDSRSLLSNRSATHRHPSRGCSRRTAAGGYLWWWPRPGPPGAHGRTEGQSCFRIARTSRRRARRPPAHLARDGLTLARTWELGLPRR